MLMQQQNQMLSVDELCWTGDVLKTDGQALRRRRRERAQQLFFSFSFQCVEHEKAFSVERRYLFRCTATLGQPARLLVK